MPPSSATKPGTTRSRQREPDSETVGETNGRTARAFRFEVRWVLPYIAVLLTIANGIAIPYIVYREQRDDKQDLALASFQEVALQFKTFMEKGDRWTEKDALRQQIEYLKALNEHSNKGGHEEMDRRVSELEADRNIDREWKSAMTSRMDQLLVEVTRIATKLENAQP